MTTTSTSTSTSIRRSLALLTVTALTAALGGTALAPAQARGYPDRLPLPDGFQPEGIATGTAPVAYLGSRLDGDIYRLDLRTGAGRVITQGPGTPSLGMKVDGRSRLFVAGGSGGDARVVDTRSGRVLRSYPFASPTTSFVNDVVLTRRTAWFTESQAPRLYGVPLGRHGRPSSGRFVTLPLRGDWQQTEDDVNANGIVETPDRRALLVVQSSTGYLFRVNPRTGVARRVDLGGTLLTNGDGLLREGRTLYAVQNRLNRVAVLRLDRDGRAGRLLRTLTSDGFDVPTTAARSGSSLYLPNARFTTTPTPTTEYYVTPLPTRP